MDEILEQLVLAERTKDKLLHQLFRSQSMSQTTSIEDLLLWLVADESNSSCSHNMYLLVPVL
jgi:hypothetical protein